MTVPERHEGQNQVLVGEVFEVVLEMGVQFFLNPVKSLYNVVEIIGMDFPEPEEHRQHQGS